MSKTLVLLKPDAVKRRLVGYIISRLEKKGLTITGMKMIHMDEGLARRHYAVHEDKPFFPSLIEFITSGPIIAAVIEGDNSVDAVRQLMGPTDPLKASAGSIRGDLGLDLAC